MIVFLLSFENSEPSNFCTNCFLNRKAPPQPPTPNVDPLFSTEPTCPFIITVVAP